MAWASHKCTAEAQRRSRGAAGCKGLRVSPGCAAAGAGLHHGTQQQHQHPGVRPPTLPPPLAPPPGQAPTWCVRPVSGRQLTRLSPPAWRAAASAVSDREAGAPSLARSTPAALSTTLNSVSAGLPSGSTRRATLRGGTGTGGRVGRGARAVQGAAPRARDGQAADDVRVAPQVHVPQHAAAQQGAALRSAGGVCVGAGAEKRGKRAGGGPTALLRMLPSQLAAHTSLGSRSMGASTVKCCWRGTPTASARYCLRTVLRLGGCEGCKGGGGRVGPGAGTTACQGWCSVQVTHSPQQQESQVRVHVRVWLCECARVTM